jgi:hypothetical protein
MDIFKIGALILRPMQGHFAVVSYDWTGRKARELQRFSTTIQAAARAEAAGGYSAVVFDTDYKIPIYFNEGSRMQSVISIATSPEELGKFLLSGGLLNPPPNLEGIFEFAVKQGYCYDHAEEINQVGDRISERINELFGG